MKRKPAAPVFKSYVVNQVALLPPAYDELIPENHLVRVVQILVIILTLLLISLTIWAIFPAT